MLKTITVYEVDFEVEFNATPYVAATFYDPAEGGEVEIEGVYLNGTEVTDMLAQHVMDKIEMQLIDWAAKAEDEVNDDYADAMEERGEYIRHMMREAA